MLLSKFPNDKKIALLFSGGADSSLLYYLLMKNHKKINLNLFIIDRFNRPIKVAENVLKLLNDKFGITTQLHLIPVPKIQQHLEVRYATTQLEKTHDIIIWGINKYPDDESIRPNKIFNFIEEKKLHLPLANYTKDAIIKEYYDNNIQDILYQTRSCGLNLSSPCKTCFNCREREWAYKKLNLPVEYGI